MPDLLEQPSRPIWVEALLAHKALIGLLLLTTCLYARVAGYDFVWDDHFFIVQNPAIQSVEHLPRYFTDIETNSLPDKAQDFRVYRPLRNISYLLDYKLFGLNPGGWHLHNLLLHLLNGTLLYGVVLSLTRNRFGAAAAAGIFLLHPVQTEGVAWVKSRDDLLAVTFTLLGTHLVLRPRKPGLLGSAHALACLAKVQAIIVLPALLWCAPNANRTHRRGALGLLGGSVLYLVVRHIVLGGSEQTSYLSGSLGRTLLHMGPVLLAYLRIFLFPVQQLADYIHMLGNPPSTLASILAWGVLAAIIGSYLCMCRTNQTLQFAGIWVVAGMLPVMNIVPMMQYMAERFVYLPMVGMSTIAATFLLQMEQKAPRIIRPVTVGILLALSGLTHLRIPVWATTISLFTSVVENAPRPTLRSQKNLLAAYLEAGMNKEANELSLSMMAQPWQQTAKADVLHLRSRVLRASQAGPSEMKPLLEQSISQDPTHAQALEDLAILHAMAGEHTQAIERFTQALEQQPGDPNILGNRALAYRAAGEEQLAEEDFLKSISSAPLRQNLLAYASLLWSQSRFVEAQQIYEQGLEHFPGDPEMLHWRARAMEKQQERILQP